MASITNDKIILNFGWQGPNSKYGGWSEGGLDVRVVDLLFKNAKTEISVHIPEKISPIAVQKLSFTCRRYHEQEWELNGRKIKPLAKESHPDLLNITIEQIRNLKIKAGFFEESPHKGSVITNNSGVITREKRELRSDRDVKLEVLEKLEIGQIYSLVITSNNLSLSARLIKEEEVPVTQTSAAEDAQLSLDQTELFQLLGDILLPLMGVKVMEFGIKLMTVSSGNNLAMNSIADQTLGIEALKSEINKIEKNALKELMIKVQASIAAWESKSLLEQNALEKEAFKACFNAIGDQGLINIMRSNLTALVQDNNLSIRTIIDELSIRFKDICINLVNK